MADATVNYSGQINNEGDILALHRDQFTGEVLTAFKENLIAGNFFLNRTIEKGKSATFYVMGETNGQYFSSGKELLGTNSIPQNKVTINIDQFLGADVFVGEDDEDMSEIEIRQRYAQRLGKAIARAKDKRLFQLAVLAARAGAIVKGGNGGTQITQANMATDAAVLAAAIYKAAETMDTKDVPDTDRTAFFKPLQYNMLVQKVDLINKDWGGAGSYADGKIIKIGHIEIKKTNNVPNTVVEEVEGTRNIYHGDFSKTVGVVATPEAVGTVTLRGMNIKSDYQLERSGTLIVAKTLEGSGILRPDCACELASA